MDTLLDTWESYTGFCYKHQFPPTLSERIKSRLYFLASQTRWEWRQHVSAVLPSGGALMDKVKSHPITQPDLGVILRVLENLSMDGSPPFRQMTAFQTSCFQSFPVTHVQRMTLSQVLAQGRESISRIKRTRKQRAIILKLRSNNCSEIVASLRMPAWEVGKQVYTDIHIDRSSSCTWRRTRPRPCGRRRGSTSSG